MFSEESIVQLADGSQKHINTIKAGDQVINKLGKPFKVRKVNAHVVDVVAVQLNNGSGVFYSSPNSKFLCHHINNSEHTIHFDTLFNIHTDTGYLKNSMKFFSPESDISISNYDEATPPLSKTVYSLELVGDATNSFFLNGVIVSCA